MSRISYEIARRAQGSDLLVFYKLGVGSYFQSTSSETRYHSPARWTLCIGSPARVHCGHGLHSWTCFAIG